MLVNERKNSRGKIEILADVLDHCQEGLKKTHIMLRAHLGYEQICYYLPHLINAGLVTQVIVAGSVVYRTTENGREFLKNYYNIMNLIAHANVDSNQKVFAHGNDCLSYKFPGNNLRTQIPPMHEKNLI
jgi:predicted transcriptional regulator